MSVPGEYCELEFHQRGWSSNSYFRVDGEVFSGAKTKKDPPVLKVDAKWNEHATFVNVKTGERETLW